MSGYVFEICIGERNEQTPRHCNYCGGDVCTRSYYYYVIPSHRPDLFENKVFHNNSCASSYINYLYSLTSKTIVSVTAEMLQRFFGEEVTED